MIDLSLPVWSLPIDWKDGLTETLEFLTTVGESASAIEQRRGLRLTPRQYFEYSYVLKGPERTYFDLLTMRSAGSPCYLPLWHDVEVLQFEFPAGSTSIGVNTTYTEFMNCDALFIGSTHDYEVCEVVGRADTLVTLAAGLVNTWPKGTRVAPMKRVRLDQQPSTTRHTELVHTARVKFCSLESNRTDAESPLNMFGLQYVLETDPNEVNDLSYTYERMMSTLDNTTGIPVMSDVTGRVLQQFSWWCKGRQTTHQLRGLFYALDGRRVPIWVPTIYSDFEPVDPIYDGALAINVKRNGFTALGGPGPQREYILIHKQDGTRYYRKITNSVILGDGTTERIFIDEAMPEDINQLRRISFLVLSRLDGDTVELLHHTATRGMTTVTAVFRSAAAKDGIENIYEVPPGPLPEPLCLNDFHWYVGSPGIGSYRMYPDQIDQYGNFYDIAGTLVKVYNTNGVLLNTYSVDDLRLAVNAWYGGAIFANNPTYYQIWATSIRQGKYVLVYGRTSHIGSGFDYWFALCEPSLSGSLTVKGAVYWFAIFGPPASSDIHIHDVFNDDDAILFTAYTNVGASTAVFGVLPSINAYLDGTYTGGWSGDPCRIPPTILYPIGNVTGLSDNLFIGLAASAPHTFGFRLPGNGRELYYIYINRRYMEQQLAATSAICPEIKNNIAPYYPNGAMLKMELSSLDFADLSGNSLGSGYYGGATELYTIDNPSWQDADAGTAIPFLDEHTYISDATSGGTDCYSTIVNVTPRSNGRYWVVFIMPGISDAQYRRPGGSTNSWQTPVYAKVRLFDFDPTTEIAVQVGEHVCIAHTNEFMSDAFGSSVLQNDGYMFTNVVEIPGEVVVIIYGRVFKVTFCKFFIPEE